MIIFIGLTAMSAPDTPLGFIAIIVARFGAMIVGTVIALKQRLKEIEGGEIYEARKY